MIHKVLSLIPSTAQEKKKKEKKKDRIQEAPGKPISPGLHVTKTKTSSLYLSPGAPGLP
jgi:hypothetical protein